MYLVCLLLFFLSQNKAQAFSFPEKIELQNLHNSKNLNIEINKINKTTILFYWASWCSRCKEVLPEVTAMQSIPNVRIFGISVDEDKKNAIAASKKDYRSILRQYWVGKKILEDMKIDLIPFIVLIGKNGKIDTVYEGSNSDKIAYFKKRIRYLTLGE